MHHAHFFTATILNWNNLLLNDSFKDTIVSALQHRVKLKQIRLYGFVIMPNHIHLLWFINPELDSSSFQRDFLKYTAKQIIEKLRMDNQDAVIQKHTINAKDRVVQIWERNSLSVDIYSLDVFNQKLNYIHNNPLQLKWQLVPHDPTQYKYSSALFYETSIDDFDMLVNFIDNF